MFRTVLIAATLLVAGPALAGAQPAGDRVASTACRCITRFPARAIR